jgi:hypothetical protein
MGCITSRDKWPPEPTRRFVIRNRWVLVNEGGKVVKKLVPVEDYVIDWPSLRCSGSYRGGEPDNDPNY